MESKGTDAGKSSSRKSFPVQTVYSTALHGIDGQIVTVESSCAPSPEHRLEIIGLPDTAVKESAARVRSAARHLQRVGAYRTGQRHDNHQQQRRHAFEIAFFLL